jgi:hypothetical protein
VISTDGSTLPGVVRLGVGVGAIPDPEAAPDAEDRGMTIKPVSTRVPVGPVLLAGVGAQLADDALYLLLPPIAVLSPLSGVIALLLTAVAARLVTRDRVGAGVARTGLAVGALSAGIGLLLGGLGLVAVLLAGITVVAGVAGAVVGRGLTDNT